MPQTPPKKILGIASVLPVPGLCNENDVVAVYFSTLQKQFSAEIRLLRPQIDSNTLLARLSPKWKNYRQILRQGDYCLKGLPVSNLPWWGIRKFPALLALLSYTLPLGNRKKIEELVQYWKPDLVHAQYLLPDGLLALWLKKKFGIPYVLTIRAEQPVRRSLLASLVWKKVLRQADAVTTVSAPVVQELSGIRSLQFIPHGIDPHEHSCEYPKSAQEPLKLITVAQLIPRKHLDKVMQALGRLKGKFPFQWTIVGRAPKSQAIDQTQNHNQTTYVQKLRDLTKKYELDSSITWIDQIPHEEVYAEMSKHHVFVMPSYPETFGRVYVEAMSCGLPVIAGKGGGMDGFLTHGETGYLANPENITELAEILQNLQTHPQLVQKIGRASQTLARDLFWDKIAKRYWEIYQGVWDSPQP